MVEGGENDGTESDGVENNGAGSDGTENYEADVHQSVHSFRRASSAASDGFRAFYEGCQAWINRRHSLVQFAIGVSVWFGANWAYNRIAPPIIRTTVALVEGISSEVILIPVFDVLETRPILVSLQVLVALVALVVAQNRRQTQKLTKAENELTIMTNRPAEMSDGGTPERHPPIAWAIGLAIAGASLGFSFGPGGVLAGIYFGLLVGGKLDRRSYERDPLTPDLNAESRLDR